MSIRPLILHTPAGGGHRAASAAIAQAMVQMIPGVQPDVRDVLEFAPSWFRYGDAWRLVQHHGGRGWDWLFDAADRLDDDRGATGAVLRAVERVRLPLNRAILGALDRYLEQTRPSHVVCTHYLPALAVARVASARDRATVVITDHQTHRSWTTPALGSYCVADAAVARAVARRVPDARVAVTGIPIALEHGGPVRAIAVEPDPARVLVLLGGVPDLDALAVVRSLAPLAAGGHTLEILTGGNRRVTEAAAQLPGSVQVADRADGLRAALDRADLVVTKAGGLIVSEALARGRGLVLPFAAPGQERGNLFHALDAGAAVRPGELADTGATVAALIDEHGRLRRMGARARLTSRPDAAMRVVEHVLGDAAVEEVRHAA